MTLPSMSAILLLAFYSSFVNKTGDTPSTLSTQCAIDVSAKTELKSKARDITQQEFLAQNKKHKHKHDISDDQQAKEQKISV